METFVKKNNKLVRIGEGKLLKKGEILLKEEVTANGGEANGIQQAQMKARQIMNKNSGVVDSVVTKAGDTDNQKDKGEDITVSADVNSSPGQLTNIAKQLPDNANLKFYDKNKTNGNNGTTSTNESRIVELRRNSVPFSKNELTKFLKSI
jgi:lipopolysaccharide export LptBFGC system permease protein LptF